MAFLKFSFFASLGELISYRFTYKVWAFPKAFLLKVLLWGVLGLLIAFSFQFYSEGVKVMLKQGKLPLSESIFSFAFFTSLTNNLTFAPLMMSFHKICHTYIHQRFGEKVQGLSFETLIESISWKPFLRMICLKKIPFFWIPVHTLTFMMPEVYRVLFASFLSFVLGVFLTTQAYGR